VPQQQVFNADDVSAALGGAVTYLGTGSFGETWRVGDQAVKIIHRDSSERVAREVEGLGRVAHPNVVHLIGAEELSVAGTTYQVLRFEYVAGGDLESALDAGRLLPVEELPAFLSGLLSGVEALHQAGVLHRDLKPGNVSLRNSAWAEPVILDLGLARLLDMSSITAYPAQVGTLMYMPPEQLLGRRVRKAADVFAVGVVTQLALTGRHPFKPPGRPLQDVGQLLRQIEAGPAALPVEVPESLRVLLARMVAAPEHKRGSAAACLRDVDSYERG
jgi:serine/threonine protein kinase